ncbi:hypothetical protein [Paenibacillus jilunlii]|nr:hypothetical protein [Paenibacillus jilunlii]
MKSGWKRPRSWEHEFSFEDTQKAFNFVIDNKQGVVKTVIRMG